MQPPLVTGKPTGTQKSTAMATQTVTLTKRQKPTGVPTGGLTAPCHASHSHQREPPPHPGAQHGQQNHHDEWQDHDEPLDHDHHRNYRHGQDSYHDDGENRHEEQASAQAPAGTSVYTRSQSHPHTAGSTSTPDTADASSDHRVFWDVTPHLPSTHDKPWVRSCRYPCKISYLAFSHRQYKRSPHPLHCLFL